MRLRQKNLLALLIFGVAISMLAGPEIVMTAAIAQDRRSDDEDERRDSDNRSERSRRSRSDRSDRGERRDEDDRRRGSSDSEDNDRPSDDQPSMSETDYAKGLVNQFDKNRNGMLEADEQGSLREPAKSADLDKDSVITREELVAHLSGNTRRPPAATNPTGAGNESADDDSRSELAGGKSKRVYTGSASGGKLGEKEKDKRRSYRFTPAAEKLPAGLPSFFSRDSNRDGQISMHEYSRSWSSRTVAEFRRLDANDDGIITAKEAAKKK